MNARQRRAEYRAYARSWPRGTKVSCASMGIAAGEVIGPWAPTALKVRPYRPRILLVRVTKATGLVNHGTVHVRPSRLVKEAA